MDIIQTDLRFWEQAIRLANEAERQNNLPVGAVICYQGEIIAEGKNAIWYPQYNPNRHAEVEALRNVPEDLWEHSGEMILYTTLEPCLMCAGAILLHHIGHVVYGSADEGGGASKVFGHMPPIFEHLLANIEWIGPAYPAACDPLFERLKVIAKKRRQNVNES